MVAMDWTDADAMVELAIDGNVICSSAAMIFWCFCMPILQCLVVRVKFVEQFVPSKADIFLSGSTNTDLILCSDLKCYLITFFPLEI